MDTHNDQPQYTVDEYRQHHIRKDAPTQRYMTVNLTVDEDICILQTLYLFNLAKKDSLFRAKDTEGNPLKYDMTPAPTSEIEYRKAYGYQY